MDSAPPGPPPPPPGGIGYAQALPNLGMAPPPHMRFAAARAPSYSSATAPSYSPATSTTTSSSSPLSQLITLQQAEGYWKLDASLSKILGFSVADLKTKCPIDCSSSSIEELWATMLALAVMEEKYSSQQDEWELVAMKAEMWLQAQPLPPSTPTLDNFKQAAKMCVSSK